MNELTKVKQRILDRIKIYTTNMERVRAFTDNERMAIGTIELIIDSEFEREFNTQLHIEHIIKDTIKEYLDKDCDDVTELLLALNKDLCERIRKENDMDYKENKCSNCGNIDLSHRKNKFCPECGRRMEG